MSGLSMPMPKAIVAATMGTSPSMKRSCARRRTSGSSPAWYATARWPSPVSRWASSSVSFREKQ